MGTTWFAIISVEVDWLSAALHLDAESQATKRSVYTTVCLED